MSNQLVLNILKESSYHPGRFIQSPSNEEAFTILENWPRWPFPIVSIYGPKGSGKTYLAHLWAQKAQASFINIQDLEKILTSEYQISSASCFVLEDFKGHEMCLKNLFHFYNWILEKKGFLLITSREPLAHISYVLKDLESRLKSIPSFELKHPDESLLLRLMQRYFEENHLHVEEKLLQFSLMRLKRDSESVLFFCEALNKEALAQHQKISLSMIKQLLESLEN